MTQSVPSSTATRSKVRRSLQFALFAVSMLWFALSDSLAGRAAHGLTTRFDLDAASPLLAALFLIFLLAVGFSLFEGVARTGKTSLRLAIGLPPRPTAAREWSVGAAIGWGIAVASVLPMALGRTLHVSFWTSQRAFGLLFLNLATLACSVLAIEIALRGYPFRRLIEALGPTWATVAMAVTLGFLHGFHPDATGISILATTIATVLLSIAWLRTHALWLPWGLHFAWSASVALLFGLPVRGVDTFATVIQTRAIGPGWLTGDDFGPDAAFFTIIVLLAAIVVLVRATSDYAWDYTRPEIIAAGYEVNPAPPAAHSAMEQQAAAKPPALVQILPTTSQSRSVDGQ
ncbi:CPBP family intramembrane glutamic endopeptidase [Granulicella arctica]|uniref:CAAX prenyl protease 2/Lysostaphin resistance protein A-like domain-containing protein n=1 Tax=Granulicella arctica TaxID=940613 RepID=A0A7Y9TLS2_9BACT|nr:CPBP family intramembrane glutamic endopeptidase [Granulicella arctica]NYF80412.1 hypothetical protein [Granulicella arctica]